MVLRKESSAHFRTCTCGETMGRALHCSLAFPGPGFHAGNSECTGSGSRTGYSAAVGCYSRTGCWFDFPTATRLAHTGCLGRNCLRYLWDPRVLDLDRIDLLVLLPLPSPGRSRKEGRQPQAGCIAGFLRRTRFLEKRRGERM